MEYRTALVFLFLYYIRPQDWVPALSGFNIIRPMILVWVACFMTRRNRPAVSGPLKTPHDWAILAYYVYVVWNAPSFNDALKGFLPYALFYSFTLHSLTSWDRVLGYLKCWNWMLVGVAAFGVASLFGVDFTGAKDATLNFDGRLSLGTWLHNNPNALAHSVVVILPLAYILYFWRKGITGRMILYPAFAALAGFCVYETKSKGAFLVGGALMVLVFVVGRPKFVQVLALATAATLGVSALSFLPRMEQMGSLSSDEGVQGRLMVWQLARQTTQTHSTGAGWQQFAGYIVWQNQVQTKATHSSYIKVGADLGITGLFFFLLPLWVALRSLLMSTKLTLEDPEKERCRRAVLLLIISYLISSWMINREYHTEYFLMIAVAAAIHRLNLADELAFRAEAQQAELAASSSGAEPSPASKPEAEEYLPGREIFAAMYEKGRRLWNRIGVVDVGIGAAMTWAVLFTWDYVLENL